VITREGKKPGVEGLRVGAALATFDDKMAAAARKLGLPVASA
jgi:hypothetical protein